MRSLAAVVVLAACTDGPPEPPRPASGPPANVASTTSWGSAGDLARVPGTIDYVARDADGRGLPMRIANGQRTRRPDPADPADPADPVDPVDSVATAAVPGTLETRREPDGRSRIYLDGVRLTERSDPTRAEHSPVRSPDGRLVAYVVQRGPRRHVWIRDVERRSEIDITPEGILDAEPAFSPDSRWVVVSRTRGHDVDLWAVPTGVGEPVRLTAERFEDVQPRWY